MPTEVLDFLTGQLWIADPSCVKRYAQREQTHREHAARIRRLLGLRDFAEVEAELAAWVDTRAWVTGDGPKAIFADAVRWLREQDVLLPGVSRLARLVARQRDVTTTRLWETVSVALTGEQRMALDALLVVAPAGRVSPLERWRTGPVRASGPQMVKALHRVAEIIGSGLSRVDIQAVVTPRRLGELARYEMGADVAQLKRHGQDRRMATLVATVAQLEATAVDDALDLLDLFMTTELIGKAHQDTDKQTIKTHPRLASAASMLVVIAEVLLEASTWGDEDEVRLSQVWEAIEARLPREQVRAAAATVAGMVPPPEAIPDGNWRAELTQRIAAVSGFVKLLTSTIEFGATAAGAPVLAAMTDLGQQLASEARWTVRNRRIHPAVVTGPWQHLVFGHPARADGSVDRAAYIFCVLDQLRTRLRRRDVYVPGSTRWGDPRAELLPEESWSQQRDTLCQDLALDPEPHTVVDRLTRALDAGWRRTAHGHAANPDLRIEHRHGRDELVLTPLDANPEPATLVALRNEVEKLLPEVEIADLPPGAHLPR